MKTAIIYASVHHKNTEKLVSAIAAKHPDIDLIDATKTVLKSLEDYDLIGITSGIYFSKFHKSVIQFISENLPAHKKTFVMYTCGSEQSVYLKIITNLISSKGSAVIGSYSCPRFDTFGPFKLVGGLQKGHPNDDEIQNAVNFYEDLIN